MVAINGLNNISGRNLRQNNSLQKFDSVEADDITLLDSLMDEETYQKMIREAYEEHDGKIETLQQEHQEKMNNFFEESITNKVMKIAEVKANYDMFIKKLKPDQHADKIAKLKEKKENAIKDVEQKLEAEKKEQIAAINASFETRKKELLTIKESKLEAL